MEIKEFPHYVSMPIKKVMDNPSEFIIPENIDAIEYLWNMNILTTQTNDYENDDSWIAIGMLSKENSKIFYEMRNNDIFLKDDAPGVLIHHGNGFRVPVKPGSKNTLENFLPLFKMLKFQDIQRDGYMTIDEFFSNYTNCWKVIKNPYLDLEPKLNDFENIDDYIDASFQYHSMRYPNMETIRVFDQEKAVKSIKEYIEEAGFLECYDEEENKIFYNKRLYENHMKYKNSVINQGLDNSEKHIR